MRSDVSFLDGADAREFLHLFLELGSVAGRLGVFTVGAHVPALGEILDCRPLRIPKTALADELPLVTDVA